jgi:RNA polymerase sigma-70 factor, ECF subfamily
MIPDLDHLLTQCRAGNELAWESLVRGFQARVYSICWHFLGNSEEARDAAQEVFIKIYRNLDHCLDAAMFLPWLIRLSRNHSIDLLRRRGVRPQADGLSSEELQMRPSSDPNPEESFMAESRRNLIHRALRQLTGLNREIVILKDIQGLAFEQIASLLKVPLGTVKSRSNRARLELAEKVLALSPQLGQPTPDATEENP